MLRYNDEAKCWYIILQKAMRKSSCGGDRILFFVSRNFMKLIIPYITRHVFLQSYNIQQESFCVAVQIVEYGLQIVVLSKESVCCIWLLKFIHQANDKISSYRYYLSGFFAIFLTYTYTLYNYFCSWRHRRFFFDIIYQHFYFVNFGSKLMLMAVNDTQKEMRNNKNNNPNKIFHARNWRRWTQSNT